MSQTEKIEQIKRVKKLLVELNHELANPDLCAHITPEGRIMSDIANAVYPQAKRIDYALTVAQSHN